MCVWIANAILYYATTPSNLPRHLAVARAYTSLPVRARARVVRMLLAVYVCMHASMLARARMQTRTALTLPIRAPTHTHAHMHTCRWKGFPQSMEKERELLLRRQSETQRELQRKYKEIEKKALQYISLRKVIQRNSHRPLPASLGTINVDSGKESGKEEDVERGGRGGRKEEGGVVMGGAAAGGKSSKKGGRSGSLKIPFVIVQVCFVRGRVGVGVGLDGCIQLPLFLHPRHLAEHGEAGKEAVAAWGSGVVWMGAQAREDTNPNLQLIPNLRSIIPQPSSLEL
jgi:hypothetical protein